MSDSHDLFWFKDIDDEFIETIIPKIAAIHGQNAEAEIVLWIGSGGGLMSCALAFLDFIKARKINLTTVGIYLVASSTILVWACGKTRKATRHCRFLFHKPSRVLSCEETDVVTLSAKECQEIVADLEKGKLEMCRLLARQFNKSIEDLRKLIEDEASLSAREMKKRGYSHGVI